MKDIYGRPVTYAAWRRRGSSWFYVSEETLYADIICAGENKFLVNILTYPPFRFKDLDHAKKTIEIVAFVRDGIAPKEGEKAVTAEKDVYLVWRYRNNSWLYLNDSITYAEITCTGENNYLLKILTCPPFRFKNLDDAKYAAEIAAFVSNPGTPGDRSCEPLVVASRYSIADVEGKERP